MAMVFQDPMTSLNPVKRIGVQITESLRHHLGMSNAQAKQTRRASCSTRSASPSRSAGSRQYPHELSGGMRQRVTIAIALACGPRLLIADEPTTALDVTVQAQILDLLDGPAAERQMAMILVTHDLGVVARRTDRIIVMYAGQVVESAPTPTSVRHTADAVHRGADGRRAAARRGRSTPTLRAIPGRPPDLINPPSGCRFSPRCPYAQDAAAPSSRRPCADRRCDRHHLYRCWYPVGRVRPWAERRREPPSRRSRGAR